MLFSYSIEMARKPERADNAVSKNKTDDEIGSSTVTLSEAKGLSRWVERCFAALSMTALTCILLSVVTLSEAKGLSRWVERCFAAAQHDSVATNTDARINLLNWIIRTYEGPDYFVNQPNPT